MDKLYSMKEASRLTGLTVRYLQILNKEGKIECVRTPGGRRRIAESEIKRLRGKRKKDERWAIYARVSSYDQKAKGDLERQIECLKEIIEKQGKEIAIVKWDVGSGLSDRRKGLKELMRLAAQGEISDLAIMDKDRLTRFGFEYLSMYFKAFNVELHIMCGEKNGSIEEELVRDMLSIVTSFSGKLYGIRSAKRKRLLENVRKVVEEKSEE